MGAYLSKPNCDKESEDKQGDVLSYGASAMQGWRLAQEVGKNERGLFGPRTLRSLDTWGGGGCTTPTYVAIMYKHDYFAAVNTAAIASKMTIAAVSQVCIRCR